MSRAEVTVLVDARNVLRSRWPNIPEGRALELSCAWAAARGMHAVVVFDGRAPGGLVGASEAAGGCTVVGTGGESADDWIIREAKRYARSGRRYWIVTSDRALRGAAGEHAERTIGGGAFAGELEAVEPA